MIQDEHQHFIGKVAQKILLEKDGNILICRAPDDTMWEFPGGRMNQDGTPYENLQREIYEELGIHIENLRPFHIIKSLHVRTNTQRLLIAYHGIIDECDLKIDTEELAEIKWVPKEELLSVDLFDDCMEAAQYLLQSQ